MWCPFPWRGDLRCRKGISVVLVRDHMRSKEHWILNPLCDIVLRTCWGCREHPELGCYVGSISSPDWGVCLEISQKPCKFRSGVAPANQTKPNKGPKRKAHEFRPFLWILVPFVRKTSTIHIELLFGNAPAKSPWTDLSLVWFAGDTPNSRDFGDINLRCRATLKSQWLCVEIPHASTLCRGILNN